MLNLTSSEFHSIAEPLLRKVFVDDDLTGQPFSENVKHKHILFGNYHKIESPLIDAILSAATTIGDSGCYISNLSTWFPRNETDNNIYDWYTPLSEFIPAYTNYYDPSQFPSLSIVNPYSLPHTIYSDRGTWGILIQEEGFGLIGGCEKFIDEVNQSIPDLREQVDYFLDYIKYLKEDPHSTLDWIPSLIHNVYEKETAERMLKKIDF